MLRNLRRVVALLGMPQDFLYFILNLLGLALVPQGLKLKRQQNSK